MPRKRGRKKGSGKKRIGIDRALISPEKPDEILFKLNELLYEQNASVIRKNPRIVVDIKLLWSLRGEIKGGNTYTISREGMFIKTPFPADVNSEIEVSFLLPGYSRLIRLRAKVLHRITPEEARTQGVLSGMAISFINPDEKIQKKLDEFINKKLKESSKPALWI